MEEPGKVKKNSHLLIFENGCIKIIFLYIIYKMSGFTCTSTLNLYNITNRKFKLLQLPQKIIIN